MAGRFLLKCDEVRYFYEFSVLDDSSSDFFKLMRKPLRPGDLTVLGVKIESCLCVVLKKLGPLVAIGAILAANAFDGVIGE